MYAAFDTKLIGTPVQYDSVSTNPKTASSGTLIGVNYDETTRLWWGLIVGADGRCVSRPLTNMRDAVVFPVTSAPSVPTSNSAGA